LHIIQRIKNNLLSPTPPQATEHTPRKIWIPFTFHSPLIYSITNLFWNIPLCITFKATNTIFCQLRQLHHATSDSSSSIYGLKCATCQKLYVGQSGRSITIRYRKQARYIRTNTPHSAYAMHILNNQHEYSPSEYTLQMSKPRHKGTLMNIQENFFIQQLHNLRLLINKQFPQELTWYTDWDAFRNRWLHRANNCPHPPERQVRSSLYQPKQTIPRG
jgi:hypothetical protein